ncbi:hypothetical protein C9374_004456 [Naegleria lovaniensis]|uniref:Aquaporin n=1 Tax=Naegleria lovaniensis TaxID=51637 RepID=A0AA88KIR5_NAELO|nr:uncharacterized protein C9374_004456 [Naegleria lovaniensis]KAG2383119.1 hypothetical protein C9374_004456 [Naegleria lovaniensis]
MNTDKAVTFGALITRNIGVVSGLAYMVVQLLGSIVGASLCLGIGKSVEAAVFNPPTELADAWRGFALEIILTFVLMITIFGTAIKPQHFRKNDGMGSVGGLIAAFPIAFALGADAMAGPLTGASMNPARAFGPQLIGNIWPTHSWIYYTAPFLGSALGALCYEFVLTKPKKLSHYASLLHIKTKSHDSEEEEEFNEKNGLLKSSSSKDGMLYTSTN